MPNKNSDGQDEYDPGFVRKDSLFDGLSEEEKNNFLESGKVLSFRRGQTVFRQGEPLHSFYMICSGIVQLSRVTPNGREVTLDILIEGDMACAKEIFEMRDTHMVTASAVKPTKIMIFPKRWLFETAQKNSVFAINLLAAISRRAQMVELDAEHQATMSAPQLAACFLMHLCNNHGFDPHGFDLPFSKSLIASRLGMELETLSRTFPVLEKYGISIKGKRVVLRDLDAADKHVCDNCSVRESCRARLSLQRKKDDEKPLQSKTHSD